MSKSLAKIYLHIIFSTKNRKKLIKPEIEIELYKYIAGILRNIDCAAIKISGTSDHLHILNTLSRTITVSKMIGLLKKDSSKWLKTKGNEFIIHSLCAEIFLLAYRRIIKRNKSRDKYFNV